MTAPVLLAPHEPAPVRRRPAVALVTLTITAHAIAYTDVRCSVCPSHGHSPTWLLALPGAVRFELLTLRSDQDRHGRGIAVRCRHCKTRYEVITHG